MGLAVDRTMVYVTAGGAWSDVKTTYNTDIPSGDFDGIVSGKGQWGWTAGVGVEHAFADAWSFKLEALYISYVNDDSSALDDTCSTSNGPSGPCTFSFDHDAWTVRAGLNYRFGGGGAISARY
jgi:outer membrane immunogenic protein